MNGLSAVMTANIGLVLATMLKGLWGDILFLKLPELHSPVKHGQACATTESLKAASDIHAPISGIISEINMAAAEKIESINVQPYNVWLFKIQANDVAQSINELALLQSANQCESGVSG